MNAACRILRTAGLALAIGLMSAANALAVRGYTITDLGATTSYPISEAQAINASEQVVGTVYDEDRTEARAFLYTGGSLGLLSTQTPMSALDINDDGLIVGAMIVSSTESHAFLYNAGVVTDLSTLGGVVSYANGINGNGLICGTSTLAGGQTHSYMYDGGVMYDIHVLAQATVLSSSTPTGNIVNSTVSEAEDINDDREIVGFFRAPNAVSVQTERAYYYKNEQLIELGSLGGSNSRALAISGNGQIVGWSESPASVQLATVFYLNGQARSLGSPTGTASWSIAYDVNDSGVIVGAADGVAFIYQGGVNTDLNTLIDSGSGWDLVAATGINNSGRITGYGTINGKTHSFLLTPITVADSSDDDDDSGDDTGISIGSLCGAGSAIPLALAALCLQAVRLRRRG